MLQLIVGGTTRRTTNGDRRRRMQNLGKKNCQAGGVVFLRWLRHSPVFRADLTPETFMHGGWMASKLISISSGSSIEI